MVRVSDHLIKHSQSARDALAQMENLGQNLTLFVQSDNDELQGSLTDGDIRRGLLRRLNLTDPVSSFMNERCSFLTAGTFSVRDVAAIRKQGIRLVPIVNKRSKIVRLVDLAITKTILPLDVVIMAGGEGRRLRPLTEHTPKPLLKIGERSIINHNIDRLISFGISDFWICIRYLGDVIKQNIGNGEDQNIKIEYVTEESPLGTIGAVRTIRGLKHDVVLVTNSDLLTDLDYEDFYENFVGSEADLSIVTIPYRVGVPYAVLETSDGNVLSFQEKPTYTYYSNGGIYLIKRDLLKLIPEGILYNATDFIQHLIEKRKRVLSYPHSSYWMDIGRLEDYEKAKRDISHLRF